VLGGAFLVLVLLTIPMTYPQAFRLRDGVNDAGDPLLNTWALAWVAHQLPIAPGHIFDANIFYPQRRSLAFSETLLVPGIAAAPLFWLGAGAVLVYNLVFLSAMVLSGLGVVLLVHELTGEAGPAIVAGIIFAFLPFRMDHYAHMQLQQTEWIPLALWALHRVSNTGRWADGVKLGALTAFQMLSCMYFGIFLVPYLAVVALVLLLADVRKKRVETGMVVSWDAPALRRRVLVLLLAGAVCLTITAPVARAYMAAKAVVGERSAEEVANGSATWRNYLSAPSMNVMYGRWSEDFGGAERRLFPGVVATALALVALWPPLSKPRIAYGVALLFAFDMSLGFNGLTYRLLYNYILPFRGLRIPARMGLMVGFTLAVLAGFGTARLTALARRPLARHVAVAVIALLVLLEYRSQPLRLTTIPLAPPDIYGDLLKDRGDAPTVAIIELPIAKEDPTFMYYSTFHWQYLLNGYSGFFPPAFDRLAHLLDEFPYGGSLTAIRGRGARYLLIHGELLYPDEYARLVSAAGQAEGLALIARRPWQGREISLYRIMY